jgi:hypothetical protein
MRLLAEFIGLAGRTEGAAIFAIDDLRGAR